MMLTVITSYFENVIGEFVIWFISLRKHIIYRNNRFKKIQWTLEQSIMLKINEYQVGDQEISLKQEGVAGW